MRDIKLFIKYLDNWSDMSLNGNIKLKEDIKMWKKTIKKGVYTIAISMFILMFFMAYGTFASDKEEAGPAEDVAEPVELVFWWYGEDEVPGMTKYIEAVAAKFNELHPNITVKPEHQPADAVVPNFLAAAAAQSGPDIATMWGGLYQLEHVWAGNIEPLSDYVSEEEMRHWPTRGLSEYGGKVWASDVFTLGFATAYNMKHFKDAGLDPEKIPATWAEFMEVSRKLEAAGHEPFVVGWKGGYQFVASGGHWLFQYITVADLKETVVG
ncbi:MAG: extracellular solute-binding protein, partial [Spirochaetota bacterium]